MRPNASLPPAYFEDMFAADPDPWRFETSDYERRKYDRTIEALGGRRYASAVEIGCANGLLTRRLADHALQVLAVDVSETALGAARRRCAGGTGVGFERMMFPKKLPTGDHDLMMLSEVVYYWCDADIEKAGDWVSEALRPGGDVLLVHWTGATDYPQSGDDAVSKLAASISAPIVTLITERTDNYRLDLWRRNL